MELRRSRSRGAADVGGTRYTLERITLERITLERIRLPSYVTLREVASDELRGSGSHVVAGVLRVRAVALQRKRSEPGNR